MFSSQELGRITWMTGRNSLTTLIHYYGGANDEALVTTSDLVEQPGDYCLSGVTTFDVS